MTEITKLVSPDSYGQRIDVVLAQLFPEFSRTQLTTWLKAGAITINQHVYQPKDKVQGGEIILMNIPETKFIEQDEAEDIPLNIVFEDEHLLIINKPVGLVVHPGAGNRQHTLVNALLHHAPELNQLPRAGLVHRLDKDTTGLLIIGKNLTSYTHLVRQMQARQIQRRYIALVYGRIIAGGTLDTAYGRDPRNRLKMAVLHEGKQAIIQYSVRQRYQHFTLLDVQLLTGRTHQIRVHMSYIKHPIVGDPLYRGSRNIPQNIDLELQQALQHFKRQALHATSINFLHPDTNHELTFTIPLTDDFQSLLTLLETDIE